MLRQVVDPIPAPGIAAAADAGAAQAAHAGRVVTIRPPMESYYNHKSALVTGGTSGIGLETARALAAMGADVALVSRNPHNAPAQVESARLRPDQKVQFIPLDVIDDQLVSATLTAWMRDNGTPDIVINSAGVVQPGLFTDLTHEQFRWMMDVNFHGMVNVIRAILPGMLQRNGGHIINLCSVAGFLGVYGYTGYAASKFAVKGFTDALRCELLDTRVRLSVVFPGDTRTPQLEYENRFKPPVLAALDEVNKVMEPADVARIILKQAARGKYAITPGPDASLFWSGVGLTGGGLIYRIVDFMIADSRRKVARNQAKYAPKDVSDPD